MAAFSGREGVRGGVVEIENEVGVVGDECYAVDGFGGEDEGLN